MLAKSAIVLAAGVVAGCTVPVAGSNQPAPAGTNQPASAGDPGATDPQAVAHVDENLARLRALDVFTVGQLVVDLPASATSCYGPCPGAEAAIAAAKTKAATRLAELADTAERAAASPAPNACAAPEIDANLAALSALHIVTVSGLIVTQPANEPSCYGVPCPASKAAAEAQNCARAGKLASIAAAAKGL